MLSVSVKKLAIIIAIGAVLFSFSFSVVGAQTPAPPDDGRTPDIASELGFTTTAKLVYDALTSIGSWFTFGGGLLLDTSLSWFVWGMAETTSYFKLDEVINTVWSLVRDLFNLLFIFGLILVGFKLILGVDDSGSKRTIVTIVIAALLINFSLYAAQVIVDFGNVLAVEMSRQINPSSSSQVMGRPVFNIADSFVAATDLNNLSSTTLSSISQLSSGAIDIPSRGIGIGQALIIGLTVALMLIVLGFVFAAGALLMVTRYFWLIFLMMFSPIMVLGWVLPQFKSRSKQWLETLLKQTLIGPAYLFMIYVSLLALQAFADVPQDQGITTFIMMSLIVSGFAWASLMVAKNIGAVGASQAMKMGEGWARQARGLAGGVTSGLAARGLRNTIGRRMYEYAESDAAKDKAANSWWGRRQLNLAKRLGDSSFDARQVGGVGKKLGLGEGVKGGYATKTKEIIEQEKKYAEGLGTVSDDDPEVKKLKEQADFTESIIKKRKSDVQEMRQSLRTAPNETARRAIRAQIEAARADIEKLEDKHNDDKEKLQREQHRRQLGKVAPTGQSAMLASDVQTKKGEIKGHIADYINAVDHPDPDPVVQARRLKMYQDMVFTAKRDLAELEKQLNKSMGGYATTVEDSGTIKNFFIGRNEKQNEKAGEDIRDVYNKKIKSKDKDK